MRSIEANATQQPNLFTTKKRSTKFMRIQCSGCPTTATVIARAWPPALASGWLACGSTEEGDLAVWCGQCAYEGRHLAWVAKRTEAACTAVEVGRDSTLETAKPGTLEDE